MTQRNIIGTEEENMQVVRLLTMLDRDPVTPVRVAVGLMIFSGIFGWLVGQGASAWLLLVLPLVAVGFIAANKPT